MPQEGSKLARRVADLQPTLGQLGAVFGTSARWVGQLRARRIMPPDGATLAENVAAWVAYRSQAND